MNKSTSTEDITLSYGERMAASDEAEAVYMAAITDQGRQFSQKELDTCIALYIEAAKNIRFLGLHGYTRQK